jgi:hypothetical protein
MTDRREFITGQDGPYLADRQTPRESHGLFIWRLGPVWRRSCSAQIKPGMTSLRRDE